MCPRGLLLAHNVDSVPDYVKLVTTNPDLETTFYLEGNGLAIIIYTRRQDLHRSLLDRVLDPPVRWFSAQAVNHGLIAAFLQCIYQPLHLPDTQVQLFGRLPLGDQLLPRGSLQNRP